LNEQARIGLSKMLFLGVGWLGVQFFYGFHTASMPFFLTNFTDSKFQISLVLSLAGVTGCIVPPIAGYLSDRTPGRFGRRRPFILAGLLGVLICLFLLPKMGGFIAVAALSGIMYSCMRTAETPYLSLLPDITPPEQRSTGSGVMNLLGSFGLISYFIIGGIVWGKNPTNAFYMVGIVSFSAVLIALSLIREPDAPPKRSDKGGGPFDYLKSIVKETSAMRFFLAQFFWWLGFWIISTFVVLFVKEELGEPEEAAFKVLAVFSIASTLFVLPLGILGDKVGRKGLLSVMIAFWAVSEIVVGFSQNLTHVLWLVGLTAIPFAAVMGVGLAYLLDLIPPERTAEFVGFSIISVAVAQIGGPLIGGALIDTLGYWAIFPATATFMYVGFVLLQFVQPRPASETAKEAAQQR